MAGWDGTGSCLLMPCAATQDRRGDRAGGQETHALRGACSALTLVLSIMQQEGPGNIVGGLPVAGREAVSPNSGIKC